ncbi:MAG: glycosyltransferase [Chitinophagaceae bacterium]|nr:glycosyltransferase [Chitinophagaceae bacterium]
MNIEVSVVIPTLNRPALLQKCLLALFQQSAARHSYEIIVVTDGPDEQSLNLVRQLASTKEQFPILKILALHAHRGPAAARNLGWRMAQAPLVIFTDDDCIPSPDLVTGYLKKFRQEGAGAIAFTGKVRVPIAGTPSDHEKNIAQLENASFITANCAISMEALTLTNGFDEDFTMAWREDSAMEFCLLKRSIPISFTAEAAVLHPVRPSRWGVSLRSEKKNMFNALLRKKYKDLYDRRIRSKPPVLYYGILLAVIGMIVSGFLPSYIGYTSLLVWIMLTALLIRKRLRGTSRQAAHVLEMIFTSMVIPPLSIFWNLYGCIRFKNLSI